MAKGERVGRNDRCPCGSGKKYKSCCERSEQRASRSGWVAVIAIAVLVALAGIVIVQRATATSDGEPICPEGQVWSVEHGHCH